MKRPFISPILSLAMANPSAFASLPLPPKRALPESKELTKFDLLAIEKARLKRERKAAEKAKRIK